MAKINNPLTNTEVDKVKPKDKEYNLLDDYSLMLRAKPTGTKSWLFNYYHPVTKKRKNLSLGQYSAFSLANARKKCTAPKALLAQKISAIVHNNDQLLVKRLKANNTFFVYDV